MCFLDDIRSLYKMIGTQSAEEQAAAVNTEQQQAQQAQQVQQVQQAQQVQQVQQAQQVQQMQQVPGAFAQSVPVESVHDSQMWD